MMQEPYGDYLLTACPVRRNSGRWSPGVTIERKTGNLHRKESFYSDDGISYILEVEAEKEGINLGKNLIVSGRVSF